MMVRASSPWYKSRIRVSGYAARYFIASAVEAVEGG